MSVSQRENEMNAEVTQKSRDFCGNVPESATTAATCHVFTPSALTILVVRCFIHQTTWLIYPKFEQIAQLRFLTSSWIPVLSDCIPDVYNIAVYI